LCAKRILRYLQVTKNYDLKFKKDNTELEGFVDADWASDLIDTRLYTGFVFKLLNCNFLGKYKTKNSLSSTEANIWLSRKHVKKLFVEKLTGTNRKFILYQFI